MKFRCERDVLAEALATAGRAVANRGGALPVLSGVRLELTGGQLEVTGSDLDLTISVTIEVAGESDGVVVLPARLASDVVRSVEDGKVVFEIDEEQARVTGGSAEFEIRLIPADEFPRLAQPEGDAVTIEAAAFGAALEAGDPRRQLGRLPADPDRGAPQRRGGRAPPRRHRLLPAGRSLDARDQRAGRGPEGAGAVTGPRRAGPGPARQWRRDPSPGRPRCRVRDRAACAWSPASSRASSPTTRA